MDSFEVCVVYGDDIDISPDILASWLLLPSRHAGPLIETGRRSSKPGSCLVSPACTSSGNQIFHSHRVRGQKLGKMATILQRSGDSNLIINKSYSSFKGYPPII